MTTRARSRRAVHLHHARGRQRRRSQQLGRSQPRLRSARRRRNLQRSDHHGHRPHQGGSHLLPGQSVYQGPASDFADHADALEQSCSDLVGTNLADLLTGAPSGRPHADDCTQVAKAAAAVELRTPPSQCGFQPMLAKDPPPLCEAGSFATQLFHDTFDGGDSPPPLERRFHGSHCGLYAAPMAGRVGPPGRSRGSAFFGLDYRGGTCAPAETSRASCTW